MQSIRSQKVIVIYQNYLTGNTGFKQLFERKDISYLCVLAAICIKTLLYLHFFQLEGDKLFQALGAKNLIEGHGLTFQHVSASDLSTPVVEPVNRWPIGFSLLLAAIYSLTGNIEASCVIIDVLSICFFIISLFKLLQLLRLPTLIINVIVLFAGAVFGPHISKPTDLLACAGLLYACFLCVSYLSNKSKSALFGVAVGAANVIPIVFRFMYLSCVWVIPVLILWTGYRKNDKRITTAGVYALLSTAVISGCIMLLQQLVVGDIVYKITTENGFFPENMLMIYPFIADAFFDINFVLQQISLITGASYVFLSECLKYFNILLLILILYKFVNYLLQKGAVSITRWDSFVILSGIINLALLLMLGYLSITNSSTFNLPGRRFEWTFIGDGRFFLFAVTILPVVAAYWLFNSPWSKLRKYQRPLQLLFFVLVLFQLAHTIYFIGKRFDPLGLKGGNVLITHPAQSYMKNTISEVRQRGWDVALTGTDETVSNWAALIGEKGILRIDELLSADIRPQTKTVVFVLIERKAFPFIGDSLAKKGFKLEKEIDKLYILSQSYRSQ